MVGRSIMVGFDGATWKLLDVLIERGVMPRLKELKEAGTFGLLHSTDPPVTGPAWVSMVTGVGPGTHGVFDFTLPGRDLFHRLPASTSKIAVSTIYEKLNPAVLLNLPVSFPPLTGNPTVTSLMTGASGPLHPSELLERPWGKSYRVVPNASLLRDGKLREYLKDIRELERVRFKALKDLWGHEEWRLFLVVFSGSDWVSHAAFGQLMAKAGVVPEGEELFADLDSYLGWMVEHLEKEDHLLLVSDHGFGVKKGFFLVNEWLARDGLLGLRPASERKSVHAFDAALHEKDALGGEKPPLAAVGRCRAPGLLGRAWRRLYRDALERWDPRLEADPSATKAIAPSAEQRGVYVNDSGRFSGGVVSPEERQQVASRLLERLSALEEPDGGPLFEWVRPVSEVYSGPLAEAGPDLLFNAPKWECSAALSLYHLDCFQREEVGGHEHDGVVLAIGGGIRSGEVEGMNIVDVAPVLLHWAGEPVPLHMEGRVPSALDLGVDVKEGSAWSLPERSGAIDEENEVAERLKGLGYLG